MIIDPSGKALHMDGMLPSNFMSISFFIFGLCQAAAGYAAWRYSSRDETGK